MPNGNNPVSSEQQTKSDELNVNNAESLLMASFADQSDDQPVKDKETADASNQQEVSEENTDDSVTSTEPSNEEAEEQNGESDSDEGVNDNPFEKSAKGWQKRVNKLTAQKKAKDDEIELLKREIQELKSGRSMAEKQQPKPAKNPVDDINDLAKLDEYLTQTRVERDKVLEMLSTDAPDFEVGDTVYTREQILGYLKILNSDLDEAIPARRKSLAFGAEVKAKAEANDALIAKNFPDFKEGSAEDEWIKEQLSDQFFEANKKILLHYAWRGLTLSQVESKYKAERASKVAKAVPPAPTSSASASVSSTKRAILQDGSVDRNFAMRNLFS